ncbi:Hypothetical predicted protein [Paramuricea clavata]|nr:Hypothetical predicted protein [Paramuricea clavata]
MGISYPCTWKPNSISFIKFSKRARPNSLFWSFKRSGLDCESTHRQRMNFIYVESNSVKLLSSWLLRSYQVDSIHSENHIRNGNYIYTSGAKNHQETRCYVIGY